ncbi:MAG: Unknown protein [uncultured Sulfurovum sp.]|uniref:Uncharacterized protein n=1 Tax=uncultured Sulfurovum sp. TaxID=269237 RepID=A0A6S6SHQ6_9BACT|nr:MAG: Unknown protein [uncultured Sulfurovum sp.]
MGTSNFHNTNASKVYAVITEDEFIWEDTRENISSELLAMKGVSFYASDDIPLRDALRSFPATSIGTLDGYINYCGFDVNIEVVAKTVSGYYEGFNLDFELKLSVEGDGYYDENLENEDEVVEGILNYGDARQQALMKRWSKNFLELINKEIDRLTTNLESVYSNYSDCLVRAGGFSNGESIYKSCGEAA